MKISFTLTKDELAQSIEDMKLFLAELVKADVLTIDDLLALTKVYDSATEVVNADEFVKVNEHLSASIKGNGHSVVVDYFIDQQTMHAMNMVSVKMAGKLVKIVMAVKSLCETVIDLEGLQKEAMAVWNSYFQSDKDKEETDENAQENISSDEKVHMSVG